ncbi:hypothetical protein [Streptosporangium sp. NPDC002721]|uniref:hypothetical protein n=1 Tax=Streptosporangium sp. NPDC002721 TaxID=3366188 RepID=UPI0036CD1B53
MLMLLWDYEMASERENLAILSLPERLALAVVAIEWTLETMSPPIQDGATLAFLDKALRAFRHAVAENRGSVSEQPELVEEFDDVYEGTEEPGTAHLLSAVMECCEASDGLNAEGAYNVLSYCYEGAMDREDIADLNVEAERNNRRCNSVILYQRDLVRSALIRGGHKGF